MREFLAAHGLLAPARAVAAARGGDVGPGQAVRINGQLVRKRNPFFVAVVFDHGDEGQALDIRTDHADLVRILSLEGGERSLLRHAQAERE